MAFKAIAAAGLMALSMAFLPTAAEAKTRVVIGIGNGWYGPGFGVRCWSRRHCNFRIGYPGFYPNYYPNYYPDYYPRYNMRRPAYYYDDPGYGRRASCGFAKEVLADRGYRKIVARDCSGPVYTFRARKNGHAFIIRVKAATARIIGVSRF